MLYDFKNGECILINKPLTWTSFQVVNKLKHALKKHPSLFFETKFINFKIGHAGTLDPLATGLLIICTGKKTKEISTYQNLKKEYTGTFFLGATTPCFDKEQEVDQTFEINHISQNDILNTAKSFVGPQLQIPPIFSAVKTKGKPTYLLARKGVEVELQSKPIEIYSFEITNINLPLISFKIECSKGTYIRSIARDFGIALKSGAYLDSLCRTKIGNFNLNSAFSIADYINKVNQQSENKTI